VDVVPEAPESDDGGGGMTKRNDALAALAFRREPIAADPQPTPEPPKPQRKTVANSSARVMLYLQPEVKRKIREIAFHEERKEHDIYLEALRDYLEKHGHRGLL
jgi:hypothetical protein